MQKGYRFKDIGKVLPQGLLFEEIVSFYKSSGATYPIKNVILVEIKKILLLISPVMIQIHQKGKWLKNGVITGL